MALPQREDSNDAATTVDGLILLSFAWRVCPTLGPQGAWKPSKFASPKVFLRDHLAPYSYKFQPLYELSATPMTNPRAADANIAAAVALKMSNFAAYDFLVPTLPDVLNFSASTKDPASKEDDENEPELSLDLIRVDTDDRPQAGNDFIVSTGAVSSTARFLAVIFAERRFALYGSSLADRTYNVYLPTGLLARESQGETASAGGDYLLIPSLTFVRRPGSAGFRGTFMFLATLLPVASASPFEENSLKRRRMTSKEIEHATMLWTSSRASREPASRDRRPVYRLDGDLRSY